MSSYVQIEKEGVVAVITLDRPKANAINTEVSLAFYQAFKTFNEDDELRVAIITGAGERFFCAGWDMTEAASGIQDVEAHGEGGFAGLNYLATVNKPVIAAVNGITVGGGWELVLGCDIVVASDTARFWFPEIQRGFIADAGGVQRLPRYLPKKIAMEVLLTGRWFEVREAAHHGLVNRVVPRTEVMSTAKELASLIAEGAPYSVKATKEAVRATETLTEVEAMTRLPELGLPVYDAMMASDDFFEGPKAFVEKRSAAFKGQ